MAHFPKISAVAIGVLSAVAGAAFANQPSDVVASDGWANTAMGSGALWSLYCPTGYPGGVQNTASGAYALYANACGTNNTASGVSALGSNTNGANNTASGYGALYNNTTASRNTAFGSEALLSNNGTVAADGWDNTAVGFAALANNTTGGGNTAVGDSALRSVSTGIQNIAVGQAAGSAFFDGSYNIDIGNDGVLGDTNTIRIGTQWDGTTGQSRTFIAGITNSAVIGGSPVYVSSTGQLGLGGTSSERYKTAVTTMGSSTAKLQLLRPVTFRFKNEPQAALQYGLIAEEVDKVYPELVIRDGAGQIQGVHYEELAPMLLNEVQQQQLKLTAQAERITVQEQQLHDMQLQLAEVKELKQQLAALKVLNQSIPASRLKLEAKDGRGDSL